MSPLPQRGSLPSLHVKRQKIILPKSLLEHATKMINLSREVFFAQSGQARTSATTHQMRTLESDYVEAKTRKHQLSSDNLEAATWKRQLGSNNLKATT